MPRRPRAGRAPISGVALVLALIVTLLTGTSATAATGTLNGIVSGPDGTPYGSFMVEVYEADGPDRWRLAASQTVWQSSTALPPGEFSLALPTGTYRACFRAPDEMWWEDVGQRCWSGGYDVWGATDIVLAEGGTTTVTPSLPLEARLRGRVVGAGGAGVSAYVAPYRRMPDGTWQWRGGEQSLADGTFVVPDLDPGTYRFCLLDVPREFLPECWEDVASLDDAQEVTVDPDTTSAIYFRVARRATISGSVTRPPASTGYVSVVAYRRQADRWQYTAADDVGGDGGYRIAGLDADTYRVCASGYDVVTACWRHGSQPAEARDIVLATSQQRTGIDLAPGPAGFVEGTLPEMYLGAQGYPNVTAWRRVGDDWEAVATGESVPVGVGNDWTYAVGSLPTGTYVVCVNHQEPEFVPAFPHTCNGGSPTPQGGEPFEVIAGATTTGIDIATGQAGEIRGRVNGATEPVRVDLYMPSGRLATTRTTDANGYYRFREIPSGSYFVGFHRETAASSLAAEWWRNRGDGGGLAGATPVPVDAAIVSGISATLDPGGTITGRLLDGSGDPVVGCQLRARAPDNALAVRRTVTDAEGYFAVGGLSTASYLVLVTRACSGAATGLYYDADSPTRTNPQVRDADPVAVVRGQTAPLAGDLVAATP
ncbi:carboxypeptidase regulatory-like domain-containing protein [Nocardioides antri]|uniref:alpha-amylase n=1 Tax=Nocardioides antri TaxID=2607659 RepID=A0A5B1M8Z4_9ACTN|nr:carboxypeptidase regulatory-like domain-containing protein [Nocardioides antri]KAA1429283.1 hypothetical protein F0U47_03590 [Nocardioides antri]